MDVLNWLINILISILVVLSSFLNTSSFEDLNSLNGVRDEVYILDVVFSPSNYSENEFLKFIDYGNESISCALYDVKEDKVVDLLNSKYDEGLDVRVVSDYKNSLNRNSVVKELRVPYKLNNGSRSLMHNKFCVIDDNIVIVGSTNPTYNGFYRNNNNFVVVESRKVADLFLDEFSELFSGVFGKGKRSKYDVVEGDNVSIKVYFCPDDSCENEILDELSYANKSVYVEAFSFTDKKIADKLISLKNKGVRVEVIMEKRQNSKYSVFNYLNESNVSVSFDCNPYNMHNKVIIIDNRTVITGSPNFSKNGMFRNDESMVIIHNEEIGRKYAEEFFELC